MAIINRIRKIFLYVLHKKERDRETATHAGSQSAQPSVGRSGEQDTYSLDDPSPSALYNTPARIAVSQSKQIALPPVAPTNMKEFQTPRVEQRSVKNLKHVEKEFRCKASLGYFAVSDALETLSVERDHEILEGAMVEITGRHIHGVIRVQSKSATVSRIFFWLGGSEWQSWKQLTGRPDGVAMLAEVLNLPRDAIDGVDFLLASKGFY